jgi:hypothetical protein
MNAIFGMAGRPFRPLPLQQGRTQLYAAGPFASTMAPTALQRQSANNPTDLFLALLVRPPNADGLEYEELTSENYQRQPLLVGNFNARFFAGQNRVRFDVSDGANVAHVGAFDLAGRLRFYGFLSGARQASTPAQEFEFPPFSLMLKKA